jgi:23S rRNA (adenine2503-C2)-methyltransferase
MTIQANTEVACPQSPVDRPHLFDLTPEELRERFADWGLPAFRVGQVMQWVYGKGVVDPAAMLNLPKDLRAELPRLLRLTSGQIVGQQRASDGVQKLLLAWHAIRGRQPLSELGGPGSLPVIDPASSSLRSECVMIPSEDSVTSGPKARRTACISSQVGCPVGCRFCASGLGGLDGNLTAGQIVEQVWRLNALPGVGRITNVVFMGMGEPLANLSAVRRALISLTADWGLGLSARRITISTVGLPAQIRRLAEVDLPVTLALSLHAPNDEIRRQLIPWAEYVTIQQLLEACRAYFEKTGREITLEYTLLGQVNDRPKHARELAQIAQSLRCNVNLIRYNEVPDLPYRRPADEDVRTFQQTLRRAGVNAHVRASRGRDISAACGQLRYESAGSSA